MRFLRRDGFARVPWRNGQGLTEEVLTAPPGAEIDAFDWRVSIAHVAADGPFSLFPGIDRTIALLEGEGLTLDLPDGRAVTLEPSGAPFAFPGEWAVASRNVGGPTMDLNVMTRRGRFSHTMERLAIDAGKVWRAPCPGVIVSEGDMHLHDGTQPVTLSRFDAVLLEAGETLAFYEAATVDVIWIGIRAA